MNLSEYIIFADGIVTLMNPLVEIVIHDIATDKIIYINGSLSDRKVGDASLIASHDLENINGIVYSKINFNGKLIKSISVLIEKKYLLCINCDISFFNAMHDMSALFLQKTKTSAHSLFVNDWQEKIHTVVHNYINSNKITFTAMKNKDKKAVVKYLYNNGALNEKNAADYIAKILNMGRATVFNYIKEWKKR